MGMHISVHCHGLCPLVEDPPYNAYPKNNTYKEGQVEGTR